ncbi:MAG: VacB/RNase II family 3'-5' exoribonuclease, partial [Romboutsia sp.]|nr:VacB/RNase II family 3'-5' exoribonuclease [Romboutsia sp.]
MDRGLIELLDIIKTYKEEGASIFNILGQLHIPSLDIDIITNDIKTLISEGLIIEKKKDVYVASEFSKVLIGTISMHKKGFGIVTCNNNNKLEIFIPPRKAKKVLHDDVVRVEIIESTKPGNRPEGEIVEIIKRGKTKYVGILTIEEGNPYGFVICDDNKIKNDIYVPVENLNNAINNQKVVCEIVKWNEKDKNPTGMIVEVLGEIGDVGIDILSIAKEFGYELDFPENVKNEANNIEEVIYKEELEGRKDLRNELIFTIDGADAKDLDDAISIKKLENGNYLLGVHIADVSHYVVENMKIDKEAVKRGTSVYLVDRVIPMLPKVLSNGICSLNPNVDRLTLSIDMEIDKNGNVIKHKIYESVINSKARMVYEDVSDILENNDEYLIEKYNLLVETFRMSEELAKILMDRRDRRGAIDFNFDEAKIILNDEGFPIDIKKYDRRIANRIIEEFMLVANETIAEHFYELDVPFVYRNHDKPDLEKVLRLEDVMNKNGLSV